jgi:hypothetical protein
MHSEVAIAARVNGKILWIIWAAWMSPSVSAYLLWVYLTLHRYWV